MPWTHTDPMTERHKFILAHEDQLFSMTELCQRFGISRKTGYKWLRRYREGGLEGLADRSRAPKQCPHRTPEAIQELVIEARQAHPRWGPRKLLDYLEPRHPEVQLPAPSTVGDLLRRKGLTQPRRSQRRPVHPGTSPIEAEAPGAVWTADFKGEFRLGSGAYCYPLTVQDAYSRYVLACEGLPSTAHGGAQPVFERLFREHGLPLSIRTDNGGPFASKALCGLSRLSVWWIKLGIDHDRIQPGCPQQNGRHERMHRTLKAETTRPPEGAFAAQQERFDAFRTEYNEIRPHQALDGAVPASRYARSSQNSSQKRPAREMPARCPEPQYPGHAEVRKVSTTGEVKFKARPLFVSAVLAGEYVALEEIDDGRWNLLFDTVLLGRLDEQSWTIHPGHPSGHPS
jgi:putative transposase